MTYSCISLYIGSYSLYIGFLFGSLCCHLKLGSGFLVSKGFRRLGFILYVDSVYSVTGPISITGVFVFEVREELNGNNGSYTNTDDHWDRVFSNILLGKFTVLKKDDDGQFILQIESKEYMLFIDDWYLQIHLDDEYLDRWLKDCTRKQATRWHNYIFDTINLGQVLLFEPHSLLYWVRNGYVNIGQENGPVWSVVRIDVFLGTTFPAAANFIVTSDLNGNNGEWTNADDLADRRRNLAQQADRARRQRVHQRDPGVGNNPANRYGPNVNLGPGNPPRVADGAPRRIQAHEEERRNKPRWRRGVVFNLENEFAYYKGPGADGPDIVHRDGGNPNRGVGASGKLYDTAVEGDIVAVHESGLGWFAINLNGDPDDLEERAMCGIYAAFEHFEFQDDGTHYPAKAGWYNVIIYKSLQANLCAANVSKELHKSCQAHASKFGFEDLQVVDDTVYWYTTGIVLTILRQSHQTIRGNTCKARATDGDILKITTNQYEARFDAIAFGRPLHISSIQCRVNPAWDRRIDFAVATRGALFDMRDGGLIRFDTPTRIDGENKWMEQYYFRLQGRNDFVKYSNSPENLVSGIRRLCGARDQFEFNYHANQMNHAVNLQQHLDELHGVAFRQRYFELSATNPVFAHYRDVEMRDEYCSFINQSAKEIMNLANNWVMAIQRWTDLYNTAGHWLYYSIYNRYLTFLEPFQSRRACSDIPHIKRELRRKYVNSELVADDDSLMVRHLEAKVKSELAKPGKAPRLFVDYGAGCMFANEIPEFVKILLNGFHQVVINHPQLGEFHLVQWVLAKPVSGDLDKVFNFLRTAMTRTNYLAQVIYSDDSCFAGRINGVEFSANGDVTSNDTGNRQFMFGVLAGLMGGIHSSRAMKLIEQLTLPIQCRNPLNRGETITIFIEGLMEGSGTVLTTPVNHIASMILGRSIFYHLATNAHLITLRDDIPQYVELGARQVGHKYVFEFNFRNGEYVHELVQFLKHSPFECEDGTWTNALNPGAILRKFGRISEVLQSKMLNVTPSVFNGMTYTERMSMFYSNMMSGLCHERSNPILDAMRERFPPKVITASARRQEFVLDLIMDSSDLERPAAVELMELWGPVAPSTGSPISARSICRRYDSVPAELQHLVDCIRSIRMGEVKHVSMLDAIFNIDYGMPRN